MPDKCPICGADTSHLSEVKSKGINTNGNVYTICYAAVMVVLVAFLLAFVSSALKPAQDANVAIDKKKQILASLNVRGIAKSEVEAKFDELIQETYVLTPDGQEIEGANAFDVETKDIGEKYPIYLAKTAAGDEAYVLPLKGRGLWGGLWGYVALTLDCEKVLGAYFDHESETAGLGALIKEEKFQSQFIGRPVMTDGKVALTVVKKGASEAETQVDGVTGATLTSKGVGEMVQNGIQQYIDAISKGIDGAIAKTCSHAPKCCEKSDCKCPEKKLCACKDGSCGDAACNCASDAKCCAREECPCACCEKIAPCEMKHGCAKHEGCSEAKQGCGDCPQKACAEAQHKCKSGNDCCKSGVCDKSGSCGKPGCDGDKACCGHK
ncbi:MAG: FMN-binding protein [Bacteroidaceae bacterium]|nr:FMN-binding protein [Bacteroidaceae bacterium]